MKEVSVEFEWLGVAGRANDDGGLRRGVADDGVAEGLHVDADLVGAAGLDADLDQGEGAVGRGRGARAP